jgi:hypothetical protein
MSATSTSLRDAFVGRIEAYCKRKGLSEDKLSRLACGGDHHALKNLRKGRATLRRLEQINMYISVGHTANTNPEAI